MNDTFTITATWDESAGHTVTFATKEEAIAAATATLAAFPDTIIVYSWEGGE